MLREFRGREEVARLLEEAGFDPLAHLSGIWVAANLLPALLIREINETMRK